ncbi:MAG: metallophosphoesterase [Planctomycetota bacterium]
MPARTPTPARILILSDLHLGRPGQGAVSADALRPLWYDTDELIINGDAAELADHSCQGQAARQLLRLQDLAEADGVRLTYLAGNHDPLITDRRFLRLADRRVFITHGDMLHDTISPWSEHAARLKALHADAYAALQRTARHEGSQGDPASAGLSPADASFDQHAAVVAHTAAMKWQEIADSSGQPKPKASRLQMKVRKARKAAAVAWYWHTLPRAAKAFARRYAPESRFFLFGHIHRAGVWLDRTDPHHHRFIINTGSFHYPRNPHAVRIANHELAFHRIQFKPAGHQLLPPRRTWPLPERVATESLPIAA